MPVKIDWLVEGWVICVCSIESITEAELVWMDQYLLELMDSSTYRRVHILSITKNLDDVPAFPAIKNLKHLKHPRLGWLVASGIESLTARRVANLMGRALNLRFRLVKTPQDAIAILNYIEQGLPDLKTPLDEHRQMLTEV